MSGDDYKEFVDKAADLLLFYFIGPVLVYAFAIMILIGIVTVIVAICA